MPGPNNEDRKRFLTSVGLGWCVGGNHASDKAFAYGHGVYCPEHIPPGPDKDAPVAGRCAAGHWAAEIWLVPRDGKHYCLPHLARIVAIALWRTHG